MNKLKQKLIRTKKNRKPKKQPRCWWASRNDDGVWTISTRRAYWPSATPFFNAYRSVRTGEGHAVPHLRLIPDNLLDFRLCAKKRYLWVGARRRSGLRGRRDLSMRTLPYSRTLLACKNPPTSTGASRKWVVSSGPCASTPTWCRTELEDSSAVSAFGSRAPLVAVLPRLSCLCEHKKIEQG